MRRSFLQVILLLPLLPPMLYRLHSEAQIHGSFQEVSELHQTMLCHLRLCPLQSTVLEYLKPYFHHRT